MLPMYSTVLTLHSFVRWVVIVLGVWAIVSVLPARLASGRPATALPGLLFSMLLDIQMLAGVLLYAALSPVTRSAMQDMGAAMKNGAWRFWAVEHPALMILAVVFGHLGRPRRGSAGIGRRAVVWYGLALLAILLATPWPFMPQGRPWVRW
jgi:hypothetical protein